jgi:mono/diheme cytochrome c family protein
VRAAFAALAMAALLTPASAGDARRSEAFARETCGRCHAVGRTGESVHRAAPPFRMIARRYTPGDLEESLAEGIVTGHRDMPEFELSPRQIGDLIAHLQRLRRR